MDNMFEKFNKAINVEGLKDDVKAASEGNSGNFEEVAVGNYEVSIKQMELKASKKGDPMLSIQFKILSNGKYHGQLLFYNQLMTTGYGIHNADELLRSLDTGVDVQFNDYVQYNEMVKDIAAAIERDGLEFALEYGKNAKGYNTWAITEVFTD